MLNNILKEEYSNIGCENKVYNFINDSDSSKFYDEFYDTEHKTELPELHKELKEKTLETVRPIEIMEEVLKIIEEKLDDSSIVIEIGGSTHQHRSANAYKRFKNYYPLDISHSSMKSYSEKYDKYSIAADATNLPFKDNSIDCIFTHTFLEHPIDPDAVLKEIARVIKPGGIVIHNDAWFCRWWQRYGVVGLKKFSNMTFEEKVIDIGAKISEIKVIRIPPIIIKRLFSNFFRRSKKPINLKYIKLKPNYTLHLGCDEDAASSIDPVDVIQFYESREFKLFKDLSLKERLFHPNKYVTLIKKLPF
jgi:ubiquinone/menaquinone biosynthesis C-methylase UbiE